MMPEWQMRLEQRLGSLEIQDDVRKDYIYHVQKTVRSYALQFIQEDTSNPPYPLTQRLLKNSKNDQINEDVLMQVVVYILDKTAKTIDALMNERLTQFEYQDQMRGMVQGLLGGVFMHDIPLRINSNDPIALEFQEINRRSEGMDAHYEHLLKMGAVEKPLCLEDLDAIQTFCDRHMITARKAFRMANGLEADEEEEQNETSQQVFVESFQTDRKMIEEGLRNTEKVEHGQNLPVVMGSVLRSADGTILAVTIIRVFPEDCSGREPLTTHLERGYSGGTIQYAGKRGKAKKHGLIEAASRGEPFVIVVIVASEVKKAATVTTSTVYQRAREKYLKNDTFTNLAFWQRGVLMKYVEEDGTERDPIEGKDDLPGKNEGGEGIMKKYGMGKKSGAFGIDSDINNKKKRREFPAPHNETLIITTEWANVSGKGEEAMKVASKTESL